MAAILSRPQCFSQDAWCNMTLIDHDELCCVKQTTQLTCPGCKRKMFLTPGWCQNPRQDCSKVCWDRWGAKNKQKKAIAIRCCHTGNKQKAKKNVQWFDTQKYCEISKNLVVAGVYTKFSGRLSEEPFPWLIQKFPCILIFKTGQPGCQLNLSQGQIRLDLTSGRPLV